MDSKAYLARFKGVQQANMDTNIHRLAANTNSIYENMEKLLLLLDFECRAYGRLSNTSQGINFTNTCIGIYLIITK